MQGVGEGDKKDFPLVPGTSRLKSGRFVDRIYRMFARLPAAKNGERGTPKREKASLFQRRASSW